MIDQKVVIPNATAAQVYEVLMDSKLHGDLIGDTATIDPVEGGYFSTFSGYSDGQTLKLEPGKLIEQTWRASDWGDEQYSTIRFQFKDTKDGVEVHFTQDNLPEGSQAEFEAGWQDNYWTPLTNCFK
jgi:activator of HSP90 ATPase